MIEEKNIANTAIATVRAREGKSEGISYILILKIEKTNFLISKNGFIVDIEKSENKKDMKAIKTKKKVTFKFLLNSII